jgi:hypothetical protein
LELVGALKDVEEWKEESSEDGGCVRMEGGHFGGGWCIGGCVRMGGGHCGGGWCIEGCVGMEGGHFRGG